MPRPFQPPSSMKVRDRLRPSPAARRTYAAIRAASHRAARRAISGAVERFPHGCVHFAVPFCKDKFPGTRRLECGQCSLSGVTEWHGAEFPTLRIGARHAEQSPLEVDVFPFQSQRFQGESQSGIEANDNQTRQRRRSSLEKPVLFFWLQEANLRLGLVQQLDASNWIVSLEQPPFPAAIEEGLKAVTSRFGRTRAPPFTRAALSCST